MMRRGLLLDRDGVINVDHGYVGKREQFDFMPGLFPFLRAAQDMGFRLAILTNQSGVARGLYTEKEFWELTGWMNKELAREGIAIDLVLASFAHAEAIIPAYKRDSFWRKPNPGMVLETIHRLRLDPKRSAFLGDKMSDMEAALAGGIDKCMLFAVQAKTPNIASVQNFDEALKVLRAF